jgi:hypothetical protein
MSFSSHHFRNVALLGSLVVLASADFVFAGWMGFRNDTKDTIVIQETMTVNGQPKLSQPQKLLVGQAVRDTLNVGAQRRFSIYDPKNPNVPIYTGNFNCPAANENILYILKPDGKGGITVDVSKTPAAAMVGPPMVGPPKK